ncbi:hypothetical protein OROGR_019131 [Orobanche gracilis]
MAGASRRRMGRGKNHALTTAESEVLDLTSVVSQDDANLGFWLMGKLVTTAAFNSRLFMKVMPQMWKLQGKVEVRAVEGNLFTFKFLNMEDREQVMKASPWTFDRFSIALKELDVDDNPSHGALTTVPFWVHVHDLPVRFRTEGVAKMLGDVLDGFLDWEEVVDDEVGVKGANSYGAWLRAVPLKGLELEPRSVSQVSGTETREAKEGGDGPEVVSKVMPEVSAAAVATVHDEELAHETETQSAGGQGVAECGIGDGRGAQGKVDASAGVTKVVSSRGKKRHASPYSKDSFGEPLPYKRTLVS